MAALLGGRPRGRARRADPARPAARRAPRHPAPRPGRAQRPDAALHPARGRALRRGLRQRLGAARRFAGPGAAARGRTRLDRTPALRPRRPGGGPDRDGAGAADRRGAPDAQLPGAARGRPRLRHARRLHVPVRPRTARAQGRPDLGPFPPRLPRPAGRAPRRGLGGAGRERAARRGHLRGALPHRGHAGGSGRRPAAQLHVHGRRLLPHDGDRRDRRAAVRDLRPRVGARERRDQPVGGHASCGPASPPSAAAFSSRARPTGTPSSASWRT